MINNNQIVHLDLDTFFVSVERLLDPKLNNRPVIVGGNPYGRGVVAGCSYEARSYGVHSAQPIRQAHRLCPQGVFLSGSYTHYAEYSKYVTDLLRDIAPICQKSSVDEFYLDLSHTERLKGNAYNWAQEIQRTVNGETHLPISFGLATNKLVAKIATTQMAKRKDDRNHHVIQGGERLFLAPFPVRALPSIGPVTEKRITPLGIETIGQLAQTSIQVLHRLFGKHGRTMNEWANGIDYSPVTISREQKSYSRETTFGEDTINADTIYATLLSLSSELAKDLREAKVFAGKFTLKLRYSDFDTVTKAIGCSYTNRDKEIYHLVTKLFRQLWTRRVRVRLLGIEATSLIADLEQQYLFNEEAEEEDKINSVLDTLRSKYGKAVIGYARALAA